MTEITQAGVLSALAKIKEPALNETLVAARLLRDVEIKGDTVHLTLVLLTPAYPGRTALENQVREAVLAMDGVTKVELKTVAEIPADNKIAMATGKSYIKQVIAVASGKGGVGKSTVAVNIAVSLAKAGARVGLMDADVYGPNIPRMMGVDQLPAAVEAGRIPPAEAHGVKMMSIGFMVPREQAIVWRGPMLHTAIRQFLQDVDWGDLDYLVIDLPPGTGDAQLSLAQTISVTGSVIVTLPQDVSIDDARRGLEMFRQLQIPIIGVVENMSYLELPNGERMTVFGEGGGKKLAEAAEVPYIGAIPMDPAVREGGDVGVPVTISHPGSAVAQALTSLAAHVSLQSGALAIKNQGTGIPINIVN
jgi:ATP-binding protein involved in chromosome partitioning